MNPLVICPHCGIKLPSNCIERHAQVCKLKPADGVLLAMRDAGWAWTEMSDVIGVSDTTIRRWVDDAPFDTPRLSIPTNGRVMTPAPTLHPELAPMFGHQHSKTNRVLDGVCNLCPMVEICWQIQRWWVLCEAPDDGDIELWNEAGFDWRVVVVEVAPNIVLEAV